MPFWYWARIVITSYSIHYTKLYDFGLRELVGEANFYSGVEAGEWERQQLVVRLLQQCGLSTPSLRET